jgi:hypothetical protein
MLFAKTVLVAGDTVQVVDGGGVGELVATKFAFNLTLDPVEVNWQSFLEF